MSGTANSTGCIDLLSALVLCDEGGHLPAGRMGACSSVEELIPVVAPFGLRDFGDLWNLANSHHVIMRALPGLGRAMAADGKERTEWIERALAKEQGRIQHAVSHLAPICKALEEVGDVIVIKSLDHWPDLGNDLDLYSNAESGEIVAVMAKRFGAHSDERSWGDRLANKWNFVVPGLPELVEVHVGRLGQTGEQVAITDSLVARSGVKQFDSHSFRVPAAEDRLIISTLQRMYRHFYLRLCDIADTARLLETETIDYEYLQSLAEPAGLWDGLATYLVIVSEYVKEFRGRGIELPSLVTGAARFGNTRVRFRQKFLRIPIFPQAARLYAAEWETLLRNGELQNALRLSLLPGLAAAAALGLKLTGSDKGIW